MRRALNILGANPKSNTRDLIHTMIWLGDVIEAQGRHAEAVNLKILKKMRGPDDSQQNATLLRSLAKLYAAQGRNAQAAFATQTLIDLGNSYFDRGRFHEAEDHYRRAIGIWSHNGSCAEEADVLDALAAIDDKDAQHQRAADQRKRAIELRVRPRSDARVLGASTANALGACMADE